MGAEREAQRRPPARATALALSLAALLLLAGAAGVLGPAVMSPAPDASDPGDPVVPRDDRASRAPAIAGAPLPETVMPLIGDDGVLQRAKDRGWPGSGSATDPILIAGLDIRTKDRTALRIQDTNLHVRVLSADIMVTGEGDGIVIDHAPHVSVHDSTIEAPNAAVRIVSSEGVQVADNRIERARFGVLAQAADAVRVHDNDFVFTGIAVYLDRPLEKRPASHGATIARNVVVGAIDLHDGLGGGIVTFGDDHEIHRNEIDDGNHTAIWVLGANTQVSGNRVRAITGHGVLAYGARGLEVAGNDLQAVSKTGIRIGSSPGVQITGNELTHALERGIDVRESEAAEIEGNEVEGSDRGIVARETTEAAIVGNRVQASTQGIDIVNSTAPEVRDNMVMDASIGGIDLFGTARAAVSFNRVERGANMGIFVGPGTNQIVLEANRVSGTPSALVIADEVSNVLVRNGHLEGFGRAGVVVREAEGVIVNGTLVERFDRGIDVVSGQDVRIAQVHARLNLVAISLQPMAEGVVVSGAVLSENAVGLHATNTDGHRMLGGDVAHNTQGILLMGAMGFELAHTFVRDNRIGLHLVNTTESLFYDNVIANDQLAGDQDFLMEASPGNRWNVTRTPGVNIMGGAWMGGNYWSGYDGPDTDDDGLGDVPYWPIPGDVADTLSVDALRTLEGPVDFYPLVTDGDPEPGEGDDPGSEERGGGGDDGGDDGEATGDSRDDEDGAGNGALGLLPRP